MLCTLPDWELIESAESRLQAIDLEARFFSPFICLEVICLTISLKNTSVFKLVILRCALFPAHPEQPPDISLFSPPSLLHIICKHFTKPDSSFAEILSFPYCFMLFLIFIIEIFINQVSSVFLELPPKCVQPFPEHEEFVFILLTLRLKLSNWN